MKKINQLIDACRVPECIAEGIYGDWEIKRFHIKKMPLAVLPEAFHHLAPYDNYTALVRIDLKRQIHSIGEVVMEDSPKEIKRHLPILTEGYGRVLISGLGLGCVVRGLLSKPEVEHIDVSEIDQNIINAVGPEFAGNQRVAIHFGNALKIKWPKASRWDFAWHDIWTNGAKHLQTLHGELLLKFRGRVNRQGAWMFPRELKRCWPGILA